VKEYLWNWMRERESIRQRRERGEPWPWTDDKALLKYRFCNVFRERDRVTEWIEANIRQPFADHQHLWFMLAIARYTNRISTLRELIGGGDTWPHRESFKPEHLTRALEQLAAAGERVYTGAYMLRAESDPKKPWYAWTKHRYIAEIVLGRLWEDRVAWSRYLESGPSIADVWAELQAHRYIGWGPFTAYELVTDLRHTRYLCDAPDIYAYANAGPGALRGLNRVFGRPLNQGLKQKQALAEMRSLLFDANNSSRPDWAEVFGPARAGCRFEMRDIEHSLCETDKHRRVLGGEGRPRGRYKRPEGA